MLMGGSAISSTVILNSARAGVFILTVATGIGAPGEQACAQWASDCTPMRRWRATGSAPPADRFTRRWRTSADKQVPINVKAADVSFPPVSLLTMQYHLLMR